MKLATALCTLCLLVASGLWPAASACAEGKRLAYVVSDLRIPFWDIMRRGIEQRAAALGYRLDVYSAENDARREVQATAKAIRDKVDGIILSPSNSSAAVTLLKLAGSAGIPVVIADVGTDGGDYVSHIASDNYGGSYQLGRLLTKAMRARGWQDGVVGIIAIPQKRANGQARTAGFMKALVEAGIKATDLRQQVDFSHQETYAFTRELVAAHPNLRALWLQGSDRYQAALDALRDAGRAGQVLLVSFDAEPTFPDLIAGGTLVGAGMQQPFMMGEEAVAAMHAHLGGKAVARQRTLPVLVVSAENLRQSLPTIRRNVLGLAAR